MVLHSSEKGPRRIGQGHDHQKRVLWALGRVCGHSEVLFELDGSSNLKLAEGRLKSEKL